MIIDTSAVFAMLSDEPDAERFEAAVVADARRLISTATLLETSIVIESRFGEAGGRELDLWIHRAAVTTVAVDGEQLETARLAWRRFGKGRHKAGLNYGDCFSYALAAVADEPLLFKGDGFSHTDIVAAPPSQ